MEPKQQQSLRRTEDGGTRAYQFYTPWIPAANTWYHIAVERNGDTPKIAVNGVFQAVTETTEIAGKTIPNLGGNFSVGTCNGVNSLNGWIDEFRFSKGVARWTKDFTPPDLPYGEWVPPTSTPTPQPTMARKTYSYGGTQPHAVTALTSGGSPPDLTGLPLRVRVIVTSP